MGYNRLAISALALLVAMPLASCRDVSAPVESNLVGSWHLQRINGQELPFVTALSASSRSDILAADIVINADGTMATSQTSKTTVGSTAVIETDGSRGTWFRSGNTLTLYSSGASLAVRINGSELSYDLDGYGMIFTR